METETTTQQSKRPNRQPLNAEEVEFVARNYSILGASGCAWKTGASTSTIYKLVERLRAKGYVIDAPKRKITRHKPKAKEVLTDKGEMVPEEDHRHTPWDDWEIQWLVDNQAKCYSEDAARHLGRAPKVVSSQARKLAQKGLIDLKTSIISRRKPYTKDDFGYANIGKFLDGSPKWVGCIIPQSNTYVAAQK